MTFACLSIANVNCGLFGKIQKRPSLAFQITTRSVITTYYGKYSKLLEGLEDQLMLDHDGIAEDAEDVEKAKDVGDGRNTGDVGEAENVGDAKNTRDIENKEVDKSNKVGEQEDAEVGNNKKGDGGDQEAGKQGYNRVGDGVGISRVPKDVKMGNNGMDDNVGNEDNWRATVENVEDSDNGVTVVVDFTDYVLADILAHLFGFLLPQSNLPPGITVAYSGQSHGKNFKFSFTSLLTSLQGLTEF